MRRAASIFVLAMLATSCTSPCRWTTNRSTVRETLVEIPGGGAIIWNIEQSSSGLWPTVNRSSAYVWEQPDRRRKALATAGSSHPGIDLSATTSELSEDGNVLRLLDDDQDVVATFDYTAGTATFFP